MSRLLPSRFGLLFGFRSMCALAAFAVAPSALSQIITNPPTDHPVCVDGSKDATGATSGGYISGSLYKGLEGDPLRNSLATFVLGIDEDDLRGPLALFADFSFLRRTNAFGNDEFVANMKFPVCIGDVPYANSVLQMRSSALIPTGAIMFDLNGDGIPDTDPALYGVKAAYGFDVSSLDAVVPHLTMELKVPLNTPKRFGGIFPNAGLRGIYKPDPALWFVTAATNDGIGDQSAARVSFNNLGVVTTDLSDVPYRMLIDVKPGNADNTINNTDNGSLTVAILTGGGFNALSVNPSTLTVGDPTLTGRSPIQRWQIKDVDNNGTPDLLAFFDIAIGSNSINTATTVLEVRGNNTTGDPVSGKEGVRVN
jgi:hypothetical protein